MLCRYCGDNLEEACLSFCSSSCVRWYFQGLKDNSKKLDLFEINIWENKTKVPSND